MKTQLFENSLLTLSFTEKRTSELSGDCKFISEMGFSLMKTQIFASSLFVFSFTEKRTSELSGDCKFISLAEELAINHRKAGCRWGCVLPLPDSRIVDI